MRVKFTLIALAPTESSVYSGSHRSGFCMRLQTRFLFMERREDGARVPEKSPNTAGCRRTVLATLWNKWKVMSFLPGALSHVAVKQGLGPVPWGARCTVGALVVSGSGSWGHCLGSSEHLLGAITCRPCGKRGGESEGKVLDGFSITRASTFIFMVIRSLFSDGTLTED